MTGGLVVLVYAITQANDYGWSSVETDRLLRRRASRCSPPSSAWERAHAEPLMPLSIFRLRTLVGANIAG